MYLSMYVGSEVGSNGRAGVILSYWIVSSVVARRERERERERESLKRARGAAT